MLTMTLDTSFSSLHLWCPRVIRNVIVNLICFKIINQCRTVSMCINLPALSIRRPANNVAIFWCVQDLA